MQKNGCLQYPDGDLQGKYSFMHKAVSSLAFRRCSACMHEDMSLGKVLQRADEKIGSHGKRRRS